MGRPAKLTIGALLVAIAALLLFLQEQAVEKGTLRSIAGIFGVPGLLLLVSGILPGRAASERTTMTFVPARLIGGLALSMAGVAVLYLYYQVLHVAPHVILIGALLAVPAGLLLAGSCWTEGCRTCRVALKELREAVHADKSALAAAVSSRGVTEILALRAQEASVTPTEVTVRFCPGCRKVALLSCPGASSALIGDQVLQLLNGLRAIPARAGGNR